jgi:TonB family protein
MTLMRAFVLLSLLVGGQAISDEPAPRAADNASVKPLPGNTPCPYPPLAQKAFVAGPVAYAAQVRPDGTVASVGVLNVPQANLGFEQTVQECLAKWRFEVAPAGETNSRVFEGQIRFRLSEADEDAIRFLIIDLEAAWNAGDMKAVDALMLQPGDSTQVHPAQDEPLHLALRDGVSPDLPWRMELEPAVRSIRYSTYDLATVRQGYFRLDPGNPVRREGRDLEAVVGKGSRGWRFARISISSGTMQPRPVGGAIREPRKVRNVRPDYPESMKARHIQGIVVLECVIAPTGRVSSVRLLRGVHDDLDRAAIEAVRKWEYTPTVIDGVPVPVIMTVTVNFRLT